MNIKGQGNHLNFVEGHYVFKLTSCFSQNMLGTGGQGKSAQCNSAQSSQRRTPHGDRSSSVTSGGNATGRSGSVNNAASSVPIVQRNDKNTYIQDEGSVNPTTATNSGNG